MNDDNSSSSANETLFQDSSSSQSDIVTIINVIYPMPLCLVSTAGNFFIFIVYTKSKSLSRLTTSFYIRLQAVSDTLLIYLGVIRYFILGVANLSLKDSSTFMCKMLNYSIFIVNFFSAWLLVMSSVDRLIFISNHNRFEVLTSRPVQVGVSLSILVIGFVLFLAQPLAYELHSSPWNSKVTCESDLIWRQMLNVIETISTVILPFVLLSILNVMLISLVKKSKKKFKYKSPTSSSNSAKISSVGGERNSVAQNSTQKTPSRKPQNFSSTLVILNVCFLVFNLPSSIVNLIRSLANLSSAALTLAQTFTTIVRYAYISLAFFAHFGSNTIFRATFFSIILRRKLSS